MQAPGTQTTNFSPTGPGWYNPVWLRLERAKTYRECEHHSFDLSPPVPWWWWCSSLKSRSLALTKLRNLSRPRFASYNQISRKSNWTDPGRQLRPTPDKRCACSIQWPITKRGFVVWLGWLVGWRAKMTAHEEVKHRRRGWIPNRTLAIRWLRDSI